MKTYTKEMQASTTPAQALELLKEGNQRFVESRRANRDLMEQARITSQDGQYPFAVILSCIDSRTSAELIFDLGIGDVFSARIAGNIANEDLLGSMEFACKAAGSKLIVVMGHSKCGAVKGACDKVDMGNLTTLLKKITPAVEDENTVTDNRTSGNSEFVEKVAAINVKRTVNDIMNGSPILKEMIDAGQIGIVGAMHDISTGVVTFYNDTQTSKQPV